MNEETQPREKPTVVRRKDAALVDQLCRRARQAILAWLRESPAHVFWHNGDAQRFSYYDFGRFLGIARSEKLDLPSVHRVLAHHSPMAFRTFQASWTGEEGNYPSVQIQLTGPSEWITVMDEAWEGLPRPPHGLSEPGGKLLNWAQQEKNQNVWAHRSTIGRQAQLRGTSWTTDFLTGLFKEIAGKTNLGLKAEQKDEEFRFNFGDPKPPAVPALEHGPLNPVLPVDFKKIEFAELERFREQLYDWILEANLPGDVTPLTVWRIQDRATLFRCFPLWKTQQWEISTLTGFLSEVGLDHGLRWGYSFQHPDPWTYVCCPKPESNWVEVAASIRRTRSIPPLTERYGISPEAGAVVKWFTTLRAKEWYGNLTPSLEENLTKRIGITPDWNEKNLPIYFTILADEISERTEWKVTVYPWSSGWGNPTHRLLVKRKPTSLDEVVRQIQILGINEGKFLLREQVQVALRSILKEPT